jgi:hypothetical protein
MTIALARELEEKRGDASGARSSILDWGIAAMDAQGHGFPDTTTADLLNRDSCGRCSVAMHHNVPSS